MPKLTPLHIEILFDHYTRGAHRKATSTHCDYTTHLFQIGLLADPSEEAQVTALGKAHISQILNLDLPTSRFVDDTGRVIPPL